MTEFTKEELESLLKIVSEWFCDPDVGQVNAELIKKIILMIDTYCEHENSHYDSGEMTVCYHCGKKL